MLHYPLLFLRKWCMYNMEGNIRQCTCMLHFDKCVILYYKCVLTSNIVLMLSCQCVLLGGNLLIHFLYDDFCILNYICLLPFDKLVMLSFICIQFNYYFITTLLRNAQTTSTILQKEAFTYL